MLDCYNGIHQQLKAAAEQRNSNTLRTLRRVSANAIISTTNTRQLHSHTHTDRESGPDTHGYNQATSKVACAQLKAK